MSKAFEPPLNKTEIANIFPQYDGFEPIEEGGQGSVFKAQNSIGLNVALKVFFPEQLRIRAEMEVQKLLELNSPYLARLVDYGPINVRGLESYFCATVYEEGEDLRKFLLREGVLSEKEVVKLIIQIGCAIDQLWKVRVVHCDVKPANILIGTDGLFRLIDLGIAKHLDAQTITQFGIILGTLGYMAPEQMMGRKNLTLRADLFSLGVVAYEALTGHHPFGGNQLTILQGKDAPSRPSDIVQVSNELENVIMAMIRRNSVFRPSSGSEIIDKLGGLKWESF